MRSLQCADRRLARRQARRLSGAGLFAPDLLKAALKQSFVMLRPDIQWKNPVMFVVEVGTVLSSSSRSSRPARCAQPGARYLPDRARRLAAPHGPVRQLRRRPWPRRAARPRPTPCARHAQETPAFRLRADGDDRGDRLHRPAGRRPGRRRGGTDHPRRRRDRRRRRLGRRIGHHRRIGPRRSARPAATAPASPAARAVLSDRIVVQITASPASRSSTA